MLILCFDVQAYFTFYVLVTINLFLSFFKIYLVFFKIIFTKLYNQRYLIPESSFSELCPFVIVFYFIGFSLPKKFLLKDSWVLRTFWPILDFTELNRCLFLLKITGMFGGFFQYCDWINSFSCKNLTNENKSFFSHE